MIVANLFCSMQFFITLSYVLMVMLMVIFCL